MGRKRSELICHRCGKQGFRRKNPDAMVHYDHVKRKAKYCYLPNSEDTYQDKDHVSVEDPPKQYWGDSELYYKLQDMAEHFHKIAGRLEKVQQKVYKFRPNPETSRKCVKHLDVFEKNFLNPVEKMLVPYHDERYAYTWTDWLKIQMDSLEYGPRAAGTKNAVPTGNVIRKGDKLIEIDRQLTGSQVKKNEKKTLQFADELIKSNRLEKALRYWIDNTNIVERVG
jgi:hypothetical protein